MKKIVYGILGAIVVAIIALEFFVFYKTDDLGLLMMSLVFFGLLLVVIINEARKKDKPVVATPKPTAHTYTKVEPTEEDKEVANQIVNTLMSKYAKTCVELDIGDEEVGLYDSKIGGSYCLPEVYEIPMVKDQELYLLAQINLEQMPAIENFPEKGLLQFFISDDDAWGLDFKNGENLFEVRYIPDIPTGEVEVVEHYSDNMPFEAKSYSLTGTLANSHPSSFCNEEIEALEKEVPELIEVTNYGIRFKNDALDELVADGLASDGGSKLGGYPVFCQYDPRDKGDKRILLFQLDSDFKHVNWGDAGVANFFISEEDLKNLDFSNVLYNWDCC